MAKKINIMMAKEVWVMEMAELEFTKKGLCPIAIKLASALCSGSTAMMLDEENTMVSVPNNVIDRVKAEAGNPGTIDEILKVLRAEKWATDWARGMCKLLSEKSEGEEYQRCVDRLLRHLAEKIKAGMS